MADMIFDDFSNRPEARWDFVSDGVMGGVSSGLAEIVGTGPNAALRLTGTVSTDNNGGFIQVRRRFSERWPGDAQGLKLRVRGNGETYHVFLKTPDLSRVWYSYRSTFVAPAEWHSARLAFSDFRPSHDAMPQSFDPSQVTSIAIAAYGADFQADVLIDRIELY